MATYAYQQNVFEGASYGYVKYNISPNIGTPISPGTTVTITGQAYLKESASKSLEISIHTTGAFKSAHVNISIPKATVTTFTLQFQMWTLNESWGSGRTFQVPLDFCFWTAANCGGNGTGTMEVAAQKLTYLSYRISPAAKSVSFERYSKSGTTYTKNDEGTYVMGKLAISLAEGRTVSDITVKTAVVTNGAGTTQTITLSNAVLTSALSSGGYVESAPSLFSSITFNTAYNYTITFTIGDAYDKAVFSVLVARSFANVHLAGASTGGVAFGKFSAATQNNPLFECEYPAVFNGGIKKGTVETVTITSINSNFRLYFTDQYPRLFRIANLVFLEGCLSPTKTLSMSSTSNQYTMFTIPASFRPSREMVWIFQGTTLCTWLMRVTTAGDCILERYRKGDAYASPAAGNWLPFSAAWVIP